jgi:Fe2+ or Zn2+ uptake regulation protein
MTKQRAVILEVLRSDKCHHTAEELFELARIKLPAISRATVYNNLRALEEEEIIRRISGDGGPDRYDNSYIPHGHLVCSVCGRVTDIDIPGIREKLCASVGEDIDSYELKVRGRCSLCKSAGCD